MQGGGPQGTRYTSGEEPLVFERHMEATRAIPANDDVPEDERVDVVVWPNAVNVAGRFAEDPSRCRAGGAGRAVGTPILVGAVEDSGPENFRASCRWSSPTGRSAPASTRSETRALRGVRADAGAHGADRRRGAAASDAVPGDGVAVVETPGGPMAVAISWEIFFGRRVREGVHAGGEVVLNPTNGSSYWLTEVQPGRPRPPAPGPWKAAGGWCRPRPPASPASSAPDGGIHQRTDVSEQQVVTPHDRALRLHDAGAGPR